MASPTAARRHRSLAIASSSIVALCLLCILGLYTIEDNVNSEAGEKGTRWMSAPGSTKAKRPRPARPSRSFLGGTDCEVHEPLPSDRTLVPTYGAAFPGSGSTVTAILIERATGVSVVEDESPEAADIDGLRRTAAVKTHYPWPVAGGETEARAELVRKGLAKPISVHPLDSEFGTAYVLLRDPLDAIPSLHNYIYEDVHREYLPQGTHTVRAPVREWIKWRDGNFAVQLRQWRLHLEYWMERFPPQKRLLITFEDMMDGERGIKEATKLAKFLSEPKELGEEGKGSSGDPGGLVVKGCDINLEAIPCVWTKVVKEHGQDDVGGKMANLKRRGKKDRPYKKENVDAAILALEEMRAKYEKTEPELAAVLEGYVERARRRETEEDLNSL